MLHRTDDVQGQFEPPWALVNLRRAKDRVIDPSAHNGYGKVLKLVHPNLPLPLGLRITERAEEIVQFILGDASRCRRLRLMQRLSLLRPTLPKGPDFLLAVRTENSCVQAWILGLLSASRSRKNS